MSFKSASASVARKEGIPMRNAQAIIAAGAMHASAKAKKVNPALNKVTAAQHGAYRHKAEKAMDKARKASY